MKKVIICDDNEKSIFELREMIDQLFPNLFVISGYVSARQLIYEVEDEFLKSADVLFVDVEMKEMEGTKVAKILQKKMPMLKIIFITFNHEHLAYFLNYKSPIQYRTELLFN